MNPQVPASFFEQIGQDPLAWEHYSEAITSWVSHFRSTATLESARKEATRFCLWACSKRLTLDLVGPVDLMDYKKFLRRPTPSKIWVGSKRRMTNEQWKPFSGPLKESSQKASFSYLKAFYKFLAMSEKISDNPFSKVKIKFEAKEKGAFRKKILSSDTRKALGVFLNENPVGIESGEMERYRVLVLFAFHTGARRSEIAAARFSDIQADRAGNFWWSVKGKGSKAAEVPISDELLEVLKVYASFKRTHYQIDLDVFSSDLPILSDSADIRRPITPHHVWVLFKNAMEKASVWAGSTGNQDIADELSASTTHWLRHTCGSYQISELGLSLIEVRDNMRHADISTTSLYLDAEDVKRHRKTSASRF